MTITPFPYQKQGVYAIEQFGGRALLADEMGLGKTFQALWWLQRSKLGTWPALVVCPASLKHNWEHEARLLLGIQPVILSGKRPSKRRAYVQAPQLTIVNYDVLRDWLPHLQDLGLRSVVLDECQYLQNRGTTRTKAAAALCQGVPHVLALSGTPLTNRPAELWPVLHMLRPDLYPGFYDYAVQYCEPVRKPWGWEYNGASNVDVLHDNLKRQLMVRRLKRDVLHELPAKVRRVVPMELADRAEYIRANTEFLSWLREQVDEAKFLRASKAVQITRVGYLLRLVAKLKARAVVDWANRFLTEQPTEKLVLFAIHKKMISLLQRRVLAQSVVVDGDVTGADRQAAVDRFQSDPNCRVFIGNLKAAGVGLTLTAASNLAFTELYWRPGDHTQAEDRIHRITQDSVAWCWWLVASDTIEERLATVLQEKQGVLGAVLDGDAATDTLDVLDQLLQALEQETAT